MENRVLKLDGSQGLGIADEFQIALLAICA
jgi:hypothetical protein